MNTKLAKGWDALSAQVNRIGARNERRFDPTGTTHTQRGRWGIVHYGVMVPGLPDPFRFLDLIVILGTARAPVFDNRALVRGTPSDSAWVLLGSGATDLFRPYGIAAGECMLAPDGGALAFGADVVLRRSGREVTLHGQQDDASVDLTMRLTPAVSHFAHLPGIYDHWSVLAEYDGTFRAGGTSFAASGLCTYEYARAVNVPLPMYFFTYQIVNVDADTQVLMTEVLGPRGLPVQRAVFVRGRDGSTAVHTRGYRHEVHEYAPDPLITPDGQPMRMPRRFSWRVVDGDGVDVIAIDGESNEDFVYGMAAGYAGSYRYEGVFRGEAISGTGYQEWIDRR